MGLDMVELVMEMEETFGITIDDRDAEKIGTVGQAYRYILDRLVLCPLAPCRSASHFYRIRRAVLAQFQAERRTIRPDSRFDDFLPETGRRRAWQALGEAAGLIMPGMEFSSRLQIAVIYSTLLMTVATGLAAWGTLGTFSVSGIFPIILGSVLFWLLALVVAYRLFQPFATHVPTDCQTIRGLVLATLAQRPESPEAEATAWHPEEVWAVLRDLIAVQLGVPKELVTEEKHFVHDFGAD